MNLKKLCCFFSYSEISICLKWLIWSLVPRVGLYTLVSHLKI